MATSGVMSTSNQFVKYTITVTQNSQNVANNTSNVTVSVRFYRTNTGYTTYGSGTLYVKINGTTYTTTLTQDHKITNSGIVLFTKTLDITHDSDGTKTLTCSAWINHNAPLTSSEQSYSQVLTTIPRKSILSASNGTLGTAQTLTVTRQSTSFTHTITYVCGTINGTICTKSSSTNISWTPLLDLATGAPNGSSVYISLTITTYNGDTVIGSNTSSITCAIPTSVVPTVSVAVEDASGYLSTYGGYVQGRSKFKITVTASGKYYSTIKSYKTTVDGKSFTTSSFTTDVIKNSGSLTISCTVTDSRGRTATATKTVTVLAYTAPKITALNVYRSNSDGAPNSTGSYLAVEFSASITALSNKNSAAYTVGYKKTTESLYNTATVTSVAGQYSVSECIYVFAADTSSSYDVVVTAIDEFSSTPKNGSGASIFKLFSMHSKGKGIAIGKIAELEDCLDIGLKLQLRNNVTFSGYGRSINWPLSTGKLFLTTNSSGTSISLPYTATGSSSWDYNYLNIVPGSKSMSVGETGHTMYIKGSTIYLGDNLVSDTVVAQGTSGIWTYRKWSSGIAECWGRTSSATVSISGVWGSLYIVDNAITSVSLPFTFKAVPITTVTPVKVNANYWIYTCYVGTTTATPSYGVARGSSNTSVQVSADLYVVGKWK